MGPDGKEKIRKIALQNIGNESYSDILTVARLKKFRVWKNYIDEYIGHSSVTR